MESTTTTIPTDDYRRGLREAWDDYDAYRTYGTYRVAEEVFSESADYQSGYEHGWRDARDTRRASDEVRG